MDPSLEIMTQIIALLKADATVSGFVGTNVYDRVPEDQTGMSLVPSPYISVESPSTTYDDYDCIDATAVSIQINVYSWGDGEAYASVECRKICKAVRKALNKVEFELDDNGFVTSTHLLTRVIRGRDGITNQGTLIFEFLVDELE